MGAMTSSIRKGRDVAGAASGARRQRRAWRYAGGALLGLLLVLVAARLALPWYLESYVNRTIDQSPDYTGSVGTIDVHSHALHTNPRVDVYLSEVQATLTNLTNIENKLDPLIATLKVQGVAMHSGQLELDMSLDPHARLPTFDLALRLLDLDVRQL